MINQDSGQSGLGGAARHSSGCAVSVPPCSPKMGLAVRRCSGLIFRVRKTLGLLPLIKFACE